MNQLEFIAYKSKFNHTNFTPLDLNKIISFSRQHNKTNNITGILVFDGENIFQYIEGDNSDIEALYQRICNDQRHLNVKLLSNGVINARQFIQWNMGYYYLNEDNLNIDELMDENTPLQNLIKFIKLTDLI